jgi:2',3'-cyclic-nucleotide 2'-phosphodiesterase (5'-nucleotidase family)
MRREGRGDRELKKIFTILHTNDIHSNLIGMGPSSDYTPFTLNDDPTRGGFARLATLIATRRAERHGMHVVAELAVLGGSEPVSTIGRRP